MPITKYNLVEGRNLKTGEPMFYALTAPVTPLTIDEMTKQVAQMCTVTQHDVLGALRALEQKIIDHLRNGDSVKIGALGTISPTLQSSATRRASEFTSANIKRIGVRYTSGVSSRYQFSSKNPDLKFQRIVPKAQA